MENFRAIIKKLEAHNGEPFDFKNRRHHFQLNESVNRIIKEANRVKADIAKVMEGFKTYDPKHYKPIIDSSQKSK